MSSPQGLTLANTFHVYFEEDWLQNFPSDFKPQYYHRYVGDFFALFTSSDHLEAFRNFVNVQHVNMSFAIENEMQNRLTFLYVQIICEDKKFTFSVHRKSNFNGFHTQFDSFLPMSICLELSTHSLIDASEYASNRFS